VNATEVWFVPFREHRTRTAIEISSNLFLPFPLKELKAISEGNHENAIKTSITPVRPRLAQEHPRCLIAPNCSKPTERETYEDLNF
jgi:hypothetical protein